jgi:hypothetical protein
VAGVYNLNAISGARLEKTDGCSVPIILLVLPPGEILPNGGNAFDVEDIGQLTSDESAQWLTDEYLDETDQFSWSDDDMRLLFDETRGRRRFQHFGLEFRRGGSYARIDESVEEDSDTAARADDDSSSTHTLFANNSPPSDSGKKAAAPKKAPLHCWCGAPCHPDPVGVHPLAEMEELPGDKWRWKGKPK